MTGRNQALSGAARATVWLVYRPAHGYEESMNPYFVCPTAELAKACAARMNAFLSRVAKRLPPVDFELEAETWSALEEKRDAALAKVRWPFGIDLRSDMCDAETQETVQVMPLKMRGRP
jgi:hypothetical protein